MNLPPVIAVIPGGTRTLILVVVLAAWLMLLRYVWNRPVGGRRQRLP